MPSLNELKEFKASFHSIGGQKAALAAKQIPLDDLELPDTEPVPLPDPALAAPAEEAPAGAAPDGESAADTADTGDFPEATGDGGFDFSAFLGAPAMDLPDPPAPDVETEAPPPAEPESVPEPPADLEAEPAAGQTAADLYAPEELLSNLNEELDAIPPETPAEQELASEGSSLDLDSLDNFDLPEEPITASDDEPPLDLAPQPPQEEASSLDLDSLDNFDLPEEPLEAAPAGETADSDLGIIHDTDLPTEPETPDESVVLAGDGDSLDFDNFDNFELPDESVATEISTESAAAEPPAAEETPVDLGDLGDLDPQPSPQGEGSPLDLPAEPEESAEVPAEEPPATEETPADLDLSAETEEVPVIEETNIDLNDLGDLDLPDEVETPDLDNLSDLDMPAETESEAPADDSAFDLGDLGDLDLPAESEEAADAPADEAPVADDAALDLGDLGDLDLPTESATTDTPADEAPIDLDDFGDLDLPAESEEAAEAPSADDSALDLGDLGDLDLPTESATTDTPAEEAPIDLDDFGDLDLPAESEEAADAPADEAPVADDAALDLGDLGDLDMPAETEAPAEENPAADDAPLDLGDLGDLDMPEESAATDTPADETPVADEAPIDLDDFGDLDLPTESADADTPADETPAADDSALDLGDLGDLDMPEDSAATDTPADEAPADEAPIDLDDFGDLDMPTESADAEAPPADDDEIDLGNFDDFEVTDESESGEGGGDSGGSSDSEDGGMDDFSFPELDNVLGASKKEAKPSDAPKPAKKNKGWGKKPKRPISEKKVEDVDEIQLSDDEMEGLQETLSRYPLNLRVACEEIIVERAVNPKQMSDLIEHLVWGATAKETAVVAGRILGKTIIIPKAFQKSTGAALEAEQASFPYIFVHKFLPLLRLFLFVAIVLASVFYLMYKFVYLPLKAEEIYKIGYERIFDGEYERANERFKEAFDIHRDKKWFYKYAEAFRDERQYIYAEQKYDELLYYYIRDKKGVLDYANLETKYLRNYAKADSILRNQLLDYSPNDIDGLLAAGDNNMEWAEIDPSRYEDARYNYARAMEKYGWKPQIVERMMKYFIRTDNLKEVLPLKSWFDNNPKYELSAESLGELGGYLLDKKLEEVPGVPNEYVQYIEGIRDILLKAVYLDPLLPEPHYHLARYYQSLGNAQEERTTLRVAARAFNDAPEGSIRRINYHIDTLQRYADALISNREFMTAEEQLVKGINVYEDAVSRRLITRTPKYGKLYAGMGDLEYFTKVGDMQASLRYYHRAEQNGYAPPEMQYRMGAAYYQLEDWKNSLEYLYTSSTGLPLNRRVLFALGNASLKRGDYFAAQGYYNRLLDTLEVQRTRLPILLPNDRPEYLELADRLMMARNNAGVAYQMLADQTGNRSYYSRALAFYAEANRAWDARNRDPVTMIRSGSTPLPYLNSRNALYPSPDYEPQIFIRIDREAREDSPWEELAPLLRMEHHGLDNLPENVTERVNELLVD